MRNILKNILIPDESEPDFKEKLKIIFLRALPFNIILVTVLFSFGYLILDISVDTTRYPDFFDSGKQFGNFLETVVLKTAFYEEFLFRFWFFLLVYFAYKTEKHRIKIIFGKRDVTPFFLWLCLAGTTLLWTLTFHSAFYAPVFFAGMIWGWLIMRTKQWWPAVLSHGICNLLIYLVVKLAYFLDPEWLNRFQ